MEWGGSRTSIWVTPLTIKEFHAQQFENFSGFGGELSGGAGQHVGWHIALSFWVPLSVFGRLNYQTLLCTCSSNGDFMLYVDIGLS